MGACQPDDSAIAMMPAPVVDLPAGVTALPWRAGAGMICGGAHGQIIAATIRNPADMALFMAAPALLQVARCVAMGVQPDFPEQWQDVQALARRILADMEAGVPA
jgi:hypothetical protein